MSVDHVSTAVIEALPLGRLRFALEDMGAYLVGGVTRTMFGAEPLAGDDIDIAVELDLQRMVERLEDEGFEVRSYDRFGTATIVPEGGVAVDLARTRAERYESPGALPIVEPASINEDLARRDFTINAIAVALDPPHLVLDPFDGRRDLARRTLRILHEGSFADDPTRAIRAARYASRLDLSLDSATERLIRATDLGSISEDRLQAELRRLASERRSAAGFALLEDWGLIRLPDDGVALIAAVTKELADPAWAGLDEAVRIDSVMLAAGVNRDLDRARALELAQLEPMRPSEAEAHASRLADAQLLLAAAAGAGWVRDCVSTWRKLTLAINGDDLIEAGIPAGPAIGRGLAEARRRLLDDGFGAGRAEQLDVALQAARGGGGNIRGGEIREAD